MITTAARIEDITLNIIEEIHVPASLDAVPTMKQARADPCP